MTPDKLREFIIWLYQNNYHIRLGDERLTASELTKLVMDYVDAQK